METVAPPADLTALILRLVLATVLGATVGLNREWSLKPAGLRTHALVSLGAALATVTGLLLTAGPAGDPASTSRIIQGVLAGIGFIGGGVILHRADARGVHGLTTAASIWIVATGGVATGAGLLTAPIVAIILALFILTFGARIDRAVHRHTNGHADDD